MNKRNDVIIEYINNKKDLTSKGNKNIKAFFLLDIINKNCKITNALKYARQDSFEIRDNKLYTKDVIINDLSILEDIEFNYKGIDMKLKKVFTEGEEDKRDLRLTTRYDFKNFVLDMSSFMRFFIEPDIDFTREELLEIKNKFIKRLDEQIERIKEHDKIEKLRKERNKKVNRLICELINED